MMRPIRAILAVCALILIHASSAPAPTATIAESPGRNETPGFALDSGLFALREMDMHHHAGHERPIPLNAWIDYSVRDGRKVIVLLDHIEPYRKTAEQYDAWTIQERTPKWYDVGERGRRMFMDSLRHAQATRRDIIIFRGWEMSEWMLERPIEQDALDAAEVIGFHVGHEYPRGPAPDGARLIRRIRQAMELQKTVQIPIILYHPFPMRWEALHRAAQAAGRDPATITAEEYRFFTPEQQEEVIRLLRGSSVYIEIAARTEPYQDRFPACREALIADVRPLVEGGVQFIVSTDGHDLRTFEKPFNPEAYCAPLGVTPRNANGIVRELLAIRARKELVHTPLAR